MQFKNHRDEAFRVSTPSGHIIRFEAGETRRVPEALTQDCIQAGLSPVEPPKRGSRAAAKE